MTDKLTGFKQLNIVYVLLAILCMIIPAAIVFGTMDIRVDTLENDQKELNAQQTLAEERMTECEKQTALMAQSLETIRKNTDEIKKDLKEHIKDTTGGGNFNKYIR